MVSESMVFLPRDRTVGTKIASSNEGPYLDTNLNIKIIHKWSTATVENEIQ